MRGCDVKVAVGSVNCVWVGRDGERERDVVGEGEGEGRAMGREREEGWERRGTRNGEQRGRRRGRGGRPRAG